MYNRRMAQFNVLSQEINLNFLEIKRAKVAHVRKVDNPYSLDKSLFTDKAIGFPIKLGTAIQRLNN